ncbi:hypothetical protein BDV11DRAFT_207431 [Aspergillus similis]
MTGGIMENNPMFSKRSNEDKRSYTFLAPTNQVSLSTDRLTAANLVNVAGSNMGVGGISTSLRLSNTTDQSYRDYQPVPYLWWWPSNHTTAPTTKTTNLTIAAFLQTDSRLGTSSKLLSNNSPDTLWCLSKKSDLKQFFVARQNMAYDLMPTILPVFYTLSGWVDSNGKRFAGLKSSNAMSVASDVTGLNLTVTRKDDAVFIMNAGLIVDCWLDPLYQAFGLVNRFGMLEWP